MNDRTLEDMERVYGEDKLNDCFPGRPEDREDVLVKMAPLIPTL